MTILVPHKQACTLTVGICFQSPTHTLDTYTHLTRTPSSHTHVSHRRQLQTQQQTWSREDVKADGPGSNEYTALTLRPNSNYPSSPGMTSPSSSQFLADIDPKWEFPRENIKLCDPLCEGQFTVLYKGLATGIKEKPVDVAIKSARGMLTICHSPTLWICSVSNQIIVQLVLYPCFYCSISASLVIARSLIKKWFCGIYYVFVVCAVDASEDDVKALMAEMEMMSSIGPHENIVSMLRVCTVGSECIATYIK